MQNSHSVSQKNVTEICPLRTYGNSPLCLTANYSKQGIADHVRSLDDLLCMVVCGGGVGWGVDGVGVRKRVGCPCPPIRNDVVTPHHLFCLEMTF